MSTGAMSAAMARMRPTLAMLLPTTLPTAIPPAPASAACTLTTSSGALVPKATTVSPITSGVRPRRSARLAAPRTSALAPPVSSAIPTSTNARCRPIAAQVCVVAR